MIPTRTLALSAIMAASLLIPAAARAEEPMEHPMMEHQMDDNPMMKMGEAFGEADTDKDGSLSLQEFLARHEAKFKEIDGNSDGKLTQEEFQAYRETMKKKMDEHREEMMKNRREKMEEHKEESAKDKEGTEEKKTK